MKVFVAAPIRNRAWILPEYLIALDRSVDHAGVTASYFFLVNDCTDESEAILRRWAAAHANVAIETVSTATTAWYRGHYSYKALADLRNRILDRFIQSDADYLFSVDSDIITPTTTLARLVSHHQDVVGGLISNVAALKVFDSWAHNLYVQLDAGAVGHPPGHQIPRDTLFPVLMTGAVYVVSRAAALSGARYGEHARGEDIPFCENLIRRGISLFVDTAAVCDHRMVDPTANGR